MSDEKRFDALLDRALETGQVPAEASPEERREIEDLLTAAGVLRATSAAFDAEAATSMHPARARFERFLQDAGRPAPTSVGRAPLGLFRRARALPRGLALAGSAVAVALLALVVLVASQTALDTTDTAVAEVLQPGDYVQLDGVVSDDSGEGDNRVLTVLTEFGIVRVSFSSQTTVLSAADGDPPARFRSGDSVTLSGDVAHDRSVHAGAVAFVQREGQAPARMKPRHLARQTTEVNGRVVALSVSPDGDHGRVLLDAGQGNHYVVTVDGEAIARLVNVSTHAPGMRVSLASREGAEPGVFSVVVDRDPPAGHGMHGFRGVIVGRDGETLQVESPRGSLDVTLTPRTRVILAQSGLDRDAFLSSEGAVGHEVVVVGPVRGDTAIAEVLAVGPRATRR